MFTTPLMLIADSQPDMWIFASRLHWQDPVFGQIDVPVGFRTNLASIPRLLRSIPFLDPDGLSRRPAAMHDALYSLGRKHGKDFADRFLRAALLVEGVSVSAANTFYYGVHLFGGPSWNSDGMTGRTEKDFSTIKAYEAWLASGGAV